MKSIKNSFANCSACPLLEFPSCIAETNCSSDITQVDVIFIAENPGKEEVKRGKPLVGTAGKLFRKYFNKFELHKQKYLLTNTVLCQTLNPDGTTGNPEPEVIERCKVNCMEIVRTCKPKLLVLMGGSPLRAFGFAKSGITEIHGDVLEWEGIPTYIMVHPSFVNRQKAAWTPKFEQAMADVAGLAGGKQIKLKKDKIKTEGKGIFRYKIPEKFYTDEYRLVDVQFLNTTSQVLYIFRDKNNNKIFHKENDMFVCYQAGIGVDRRKIVPYDKLDQIHIKYRDRYSLDSDITYEGDVKITVKHAQDYYHYNKGEPKTPLNVMFLDIEVDTGDEQVFPDQKEAKYPINMLTTIFNGEKIHYVLDNGTEEIRMREDVDYKIFKLEDEKKMLKEFIKDVNKTDPDFIAGWNLINFDMDYLFSRFKNLGIPPKSFSNFGEVYIDADKYICNIPGMVAMDQDFLYRTFTFTKMENYKLAFISAHELDGVTKIDLPLPFNQMYWKMLNKTIEYNIRDTELIEKLDAKLKHINLMNELRIICNTSFESLSSSGQIDGLMVSFLKNQGRASKNANPHIKKEKYPGAFVFEPIPGVYDDITDFDFASLYPSIILTYNIGVNSFVMKTRDLTHGYELAYYPENLPDHVPVIIDPLYEKKEMVVPKEKLLKRIKDDDLVHTINGCFFKSHHKYMSSFAEVVDMLLGTRKEYKGKMFEAIEAKDKDMEDFYFTRQLVYKVLANTLYGVVAQKAFRFFDVSLASAITLGGQEALKTSIIEGDAFMRHLDTGKPYKPPVPLSKAEMFGEKMPERTNEYIVTGDTDSIFCCFQNFKGERTVGNILNWCSQIEDFLNKDKIVKVVEKHNVDTQFNRLVLKNELVISRGLFLAKKRYAIRVINNEGKDVDKINYMGVEIKRSDYPSKSKDFLSTLSELILKSEKVSLKKLMEYVHHKEPEFLKAVRAGDKTIARPVSWGKELKDYKTIPQGVKAMQFWNNVMYNIHKKGVKAYMYWVSGIDPEKAPIDIMKKYEKYVGEGNEVKVIAIPDEEPKLPEYFIPDVRASMQFIFKDRYELMLQPLMNVRKNMEILTV